MAAGKEVGSGGRIERLNLMEGVFWVLEVGSRLLK